MWRELGSRANEILEIGVVQSIAKALGIVFLGFLAAKIVNRRLRASSLHSQTRLLLRRALSGIIIAISITWALSIAGLDVGVLLGTAGILTVAIGFASQTSVSNLISGAFLMAERPFKVGDVIQVSETTGEVIAIDLLSVKLRTFDNLLVRIPNETMFKANVTNNSHFDIRRYDLQVGVAYKEDIRRVRDVLFAVAEENLLCLKHPAPLLIFLGFGDSSVDLQFSVWAKKSSYLDVRNSIAEEVKAAFDRVGIEIPFPHRTLYSGAVTAPLPIRLVTGRKEEDDNKRQP